MDDVLEQWYKSCLDWYDIWEEMHPQVLEHKEEYPDAELTMKLHEAEEAVKNEKAWLSLDELKKSSRTIKYKTQKQSFKQLSNKYPDKQNHFQMTLICLFRIFLFSFVKLVGVLKFYFLVIFTA